MKIITMLERLVGYTSIISPDLPNLLQPGLSPEQIYHIAPIPYKLPKEVLMLYQWHNGTHQDPDKPEQPLFYYHTFMPIQEAYEVYQWKMQFNKEENDQIFEPRLFPLFTFQGEYYATWCSDEEQESGSIFFDYHGCGQVYDTLELMLTAITECYETGAYYLKDNTYEADESRVAHIKAYWNICRHEPDDTILNYHP